MENKLVLLGSENAGNMLWPCSDAAQAYNSVLTGKQHRHWTFNLKRAKGPLFTVLDSMIDVLTGRR